MNDKVYKTDEEVLRRALEIREAALFRETSLVSPRECSAYLIEKLAALPHEVFALVLLDTRHRVIAFVELFRGSIDGASVYPREVVKCALEHNAVAVIFAHNHPSGIGDPSRADIDITAALKRALALIDIRVLDHFIIGGNSATSLAERGLL